MLLSAAVDFVTPQRRYHSTIFPLTSPIPRNPQLPPLSTSSLSINLAVHRISRRRRMMSSEQATMAAPEEPDEMSEMDFMPILENGVFRFDCSDSHRSAAFPSLSFAESTARETALLAADPAAPVFRPSFSLSGKFQKVEIKLPPATSFYGTGEVSGPLERTGRRIFTWNTDAWGYGSKTTSLYQSHPWVLAVFPDGTSLGVLADTTRRCEVDLREESVIKFVADAAYPVITFGPFQAPADAVLSLSHAIGTVCMPPKWALGYHQCRFSYMSSDRVLEVARTFRAKDIPCDVLWMDIDYMDGFRCFTFNKETFPDPQGMVDELHTQGFKAIWMLNPGIKDDEGYFAFNSGSTHDIWIQDAEGKPYVGVVWPGPCVFPDYTNQRARSWWIELVRGFIQNGVDGIWNDMNEPAIFTTSTKTMPESNIHRGDGDLGGQQSHSHYHNVYGMLMARSTYEGMRVAEETKRPFVLTRAAFIGSQRFAAMWTGDNLSTWEHLHMSLPMVLQLGLSGQPLAGPDIGGFAGNATPRLFARWMGIGAMFPFSRGHTEAKTIDHEPWSFGPECEEVCRLALQRRYRILPHLYTLFYSAHTKGTPVATPTFFADPQHPELRTVENSFLLGPLLICSSTSPEKGAHQVSHVLPSGIWHRFDFEDSHPDLPLMFLRGGAIIPVSEPHNHVGEATASSNLSLIIALDEDGNAEGILFEDDGDGYGYTHGEYLLTHYVAARTNSSIVTVKVSRTEGSWKRLDRVIHVQLLLGSGAMVRSQGIDGEEVTVKLPSEVEAIDLVNASEAQYQQRLSQFNPIPDADVLLPLVSNIVKVPVDVKSGEWLLKVVPSIGGRIISMMHLPSGKQWLHSRFEMDGYEEYSGTEYRSAGCSEAYQVVGNLEMSGEEDSLILEGDIGGGLVLRREISVPEHDPRILSIDSSILARSIGAGAGGFSRLVCLRVHPTFELMNPTETTVTFTARDGSQHAVSPDDEEQFFTGGLLPDGEWRLVDRSSGLSLVNRFDVNQVDRCLVHWGTRSVNLELWSEERPVSAETPLRISHHYEVVHIV